jgi:hypothetical protein
MVSFARNSESEVATMAAKGPSSFYRWLGVFPLLAIPVLLLNFLVLTGLGGTGDEHEAWLGSTIFTIYGLSGDSWSLSPGDLFVVMGLIFLFVEILKSTRTDAIALTNHAIAALTFVLMLIEFLIVKGFMNSTFFILMMMQLIDIIAGYTVTVVAAKRDIGSSAGIVGTN